jgi:cytoskeletal protein CcmA (bactofilin family)
MSFIDSLGKHQLLMSMFSNSNVNGHQMDEHAGNKHRQINIIGQGTVVEGTIETGENIRIGGTVHGEVISAGRVVVAEAGRIEGDVQAESADIAGQVQGEVRIDDRLFIRASAVIMGNIQTEQLAVEEGGCFTGRCIMNGADIESMSIARDDENLLESEVAEDAEKIRQEQSAAAA